jgi:ABC-type nitrate/sulfonate/bicarbonate transport system substrate-binding protein
MSITETLESKSKRHDAVDVWYTVCPVPAASSLAIARDEFEEAFRETDVDLRYIRSHPDRKVRESHYDQSQPNAFREGGNIPPIWAKSLGRNLRLIGLSWIDHYSAVLSLPGSGIETASDLRGKKLGLIKRPNDPVDYPRATSLRAYLSALATANLGYKDVEFVDIPIVEALVGAPPSTGAFSRSLFSARTLRRWQGPELLALLSGKVDAIHVHGQGVEIQALIDAKVVSDIRAFPDARQRIDNLAPIAFTVRGELLDSRPDIVARYLAQAIRTARWAKGNQSEAKRLIARDSGIAEEWVDHAYSSDVANVLEPSLSPQLIEMITEQKDFLLQYGFIPNDFSVADWVASGPLEEALQLVAQS